MSFESVSLTQGYYQCLPVHLAEFLINYDPDYDSGRKVLYQGKTWNVFIGVQVGETNVFIRAHNQDEFHMWNCTSAAKIKISHFNGSGIRDYTIDFNEEGEFFSKLMIQAEVQKGWETPPKISEKVANLAMLWIQKHGLQRHCKDLTGREFYIPKKEKPFEPPQSSTLSPSTINQVEEPQNYTKLFIRIVLAAATIYLIYSVASRLLLKPNDDLEMLAHSLSPGFFN